MKIYIEQEEQKDIEQSVEMPEEKRKAPSKRNIVNIFDIKTILKEIEKYNVKVEVLPRLEKLNNGLFAIHIRAPYQGNDGLMGTDSRDAADVRLIVDYSNNKALAMSCSGSDKETMLVISSIANKHINEPFKYDKNLRGKI